MRLATILHLAIIAVLITAATSQAPPIRYINHTVGDNAGWFFNSTTNTTATNYSSWAASQTFNLGDYLSKLRISKCERTREHFPSVC
jgi:hypothetical protein